MAFPTLKPTSRSFDPGNWPVKTFRSQSGAEVRILYGSARVDLQLELSYDNITDSQAEEFLTHFDETLGTFRTFQVPSAVRTGWSGTADSLDVSGSQAWRYSDSPKVTAIRPGVSSVQVKLVGVL